MSSTTIGTHTVNMSFVSRSSTPQQIIAANVKRLAVVIQNTSNKDMYIKYGPGCASDCFTMIIGGGEHVELTKNWRGEITGFWDKGASSGGAMITEVVPDA